MSDNKFIKHSEKMQKQIMNIFDGKPLPLVGFTITNVIYSICLQLEEDYDNFLDNMEVTLKQMREELKK